MRGSSHYRAQADHARLLADVTFQPNVAEALRRVAEQFDDLADQVATRESDTIDPEIAEHAT